MPTPRFIAHPVFEPARKQLRYLPEGPRILQNYPGGGGAKLGWVAIQHAAEVQQGSLNILDLASGENQSIPVPGRPGFFVETTQPGVVLVGLERRLVYCDLVTGTLEETGIEVTADKKVIWALRSWAPPADLGPSTTIQILDEPSAPENVHFGDIR